MMDEIYPQHQLHHIYEISKDGTLRQTQNKPFGL